MTPFPSVLCTSLLLSWTAMLGASGGQASIENARAACPVEFDLTGGLDGVAKVRFTVEMPDGRVERLPAVAVHPPFPRPRGFFEGPMLPRDSGGGFLILEVVDPVTGKIVHTAGAPIGF